MNSQQKIDLPDFGLSFTIPSGWTGGEEGEYIILGHQSIPGMMALSKNNSNSADALKKQAEMGIYDEGLVLKADGSFEVRSENRVEGMYQGQFNGTPVKAFAVGLINRLSNGINAMILTARSEFSDTHIGEVNKLIGSVKFYKARDSEVTKKWKSEIAGNKLRHLSSTSGSDYNDGISGSSSEVIINLCSDGRFNYYSNYNSSFDDNSGFGHIDSTKDKVGNYKVYSLGNDSYLSLYFNSGDVYEYKLSRNSEGNLMLDDRKFFIVALEGCR